MTVLRLEAIVVIFAATACAWFVLGASIGVRTGEGEGKLAREVELLWGGPHQQVARASQAGAAQLLLLVLCYAFFFEGHTGLDEDARRVIALFALVQLTSRVRWAEVFASREPVRGEAG